MYSAYVRLLSLAYEEMAESITGEESEYLEKKYAGTTWQKILDQSSPDEVLDYILHTRKQRETLKKYGSKEKRAELKLSACLHLEAGLNLFQSLSAFGLSKAKGNKAMLELALRTRSEITHTELYSPLYHLEKWNEELGEAFDLIEKLIPSQKTS